jgi:hypothetical protein
MFGDPARPEGRRIDNIVYQRAEAIKRRAAGETLASSQGFPIFVEAKLYELKLERGIGPCSPSRAFAQTNSRFDRSTARYDTDPDRPSFRAHPHARARNH